jgi:hypothetical protein
VAPQTTQDGISFRYRLRVFVSTSGTSYFADQIDSAVARFSYCVDTFPQAVQTYGNTVDPLIVFA